MIMYVQLRLQMLYYEQIFLKILRKKYEVIKIGNIITYIGSLYYIFNRVFVLSILFG